MIMMGYSLKYHVIMDHVFGKNLEHMQFNGLAEGNILTGHRGFLHGFTRGDHLSMFPSSISKRIVENAEQKEVSEPREPALN